MALRANLFDATAYDRRLAEDRLMEMGIPALTARRIVNEMEATYKREQLLADLAKGRTVSLTAGK